MAPSDPESWRFRACLRVVVPGPRRRVVPAGSAGEPPRIAILMGSALTPAKSQ